MRLPFGKVFGRISCGAERSAKKKREKNMQNKTLLGAEEIRATSCYCYLRKKEIEITTQDLCDKHIQTNPERRFTLCKKTNKKTNNLNATEFPVAAR